MTQLVARRLVEGRLLGVRTTPNLGGLTVLSASVARQQPQSIEQIGKGMGVATKELKLPVIKLVGVKQLVIQGNRRGTACLAR